MRRSIRLLTTICTLIALAVTGCPLAAAESGERWDSDDPRADDWAEAWDIDRGTHLNRPARDIDEIAGSYWGDGPYVDPEWWTGWSDQPYHADRPFLEPAPDGFGVEPDAAETRQRDDGASEQSGSDVWRYDQHSGWLPEMQESQAGVIGEDRAIFGGDSMTHTGFWDP